MATTKKVTTVESYEDKQVQWHKKLMAAQKDFKPVKKSVFNSFAKFNASNRSDLQDAVEDAMQKNDLEVHWKSDLKEQTNSYIGVMRCIVTDVETGYSDESSAPILFPQRLNKSTGTMEKQTDPISYEIGCAFAMKQALKEITGLNQREEVEQAAQEDKSKEEIKQEAEEKLPSKSLFDKARDAMLMCRMSKSELKLKLQKAEDYCLQGKLTEDELISLQQEFAQDLEIKE